MGKKKVFYKVFFANEGLMGLNDFRRGRGG
jgi:hypothetical protein